MRDIIVLVKIDLSNIEAAKLLLSVLLFLIGGQICGNLQS